MSTQRRSFFALGGANPDHVQLPPIPNFSLCGGEVFTLDCNFYTEHKEDEDIFLTQHGVFSLGMTNGTVYFEATHLGRIQTVALQSPIEEYSWTNLTVVYNGNKLSIYLQGFLAAEKTVGTGTRLVDDKTRYQIGLMEGYLLEVAVYSKAMTADEVRKHQFIPQVQAADAQLLADFDAFVPTDKGKHHLPLQMIGACETVNLVEAMTCDKDGGALPLGSSPVNPGGQGLADYTLLVKAYSSYKVVAEDVYLFANGALGEADTIALGLGGNQTKPFFQVGSQRFLFDGSIKPNLWVDVAVTVSGQALTFYLDGVISGTATLSAPFMRQSPAALTFGNILTRNRFANGFTGFLDFVAVFSQARSSSQIFDYADIAPYAFDRELGALWLFHGGEAEEVMHHGAVTMTGGAKVTLCENTVLDRIVPALTFAIPNTPSGLNTLQTWEANTAAKAFALCVKELTGLEPQNCFTPQGELYGSLAKIVYAEHKNNSAIGEIEIEQKASAQNMGEILKYALAGAALGIICYGLYGLYVSKSNRAVTFMIRFRRWMGNLWAASYSGLVGSSAGLMTEHLINNPPPDSETADTDEYTLSLVSLSFYHSQSEEAGALCARPDFSHPPVLPEWVHTVTPPAPALYHRNIPTGKIPALRAVFSITLKKPGTYTIILGAKAHIDSTHSRLLGTLKEKSITVSASSSQTIEFPLDSNILAQVSLGKHQISWGWYYKAKSSHVLKTTTHEIHVIHDKPLSPWTSGKDSTCLPVYSLLNCCAEIAAYEDTEPNATKCFSNRMVDWMQTKGRFVARGRNETASYAGWDPYHIDLTFNLVGFTLNLEKVKPLPVTFMDIACIQLLLTRIEGMNELHLFEMKSVFSSDLNTRIGKGLGGIALPSTHIDAYYACGTLPVGQSPLIWDAFAVLKGPDGKDFIAKGVPFYELSSKDTLVDAPNKGLYRTLLCRQGSSCELVMHTQKIFIGALLPKSIKPYKNVNLIRSPVRPDFTQQIKEAFPLKPAPMRCHSISYSYMQDCIITFINKYIEKPQREIRDQCIKALENLLTAVTGYHFMPEATDVTSAQARMAWLALGEVDGEEGLIPLLYSPIDVEEIAAAADQLLVALNNILINLRVGSGYWNVRIQAHYDCREWVYVYENDEEFYFGSGHTYPSMDTQAILTGYPPFLSPGFYLLDKEDCRKMDILGDFTLSGQDFYLPGFRKTTLLDTGDVARNATDIRHRILFSSSNQWDLDNFRSVEMKENDCFPIFIVKGGEWVALPYVSPSCTASIQLD